MYTIQLLLHVVVCYCVRCVYVTDFFTVRLEPFVPGQVSLSRLSLYTRMTATDVIRAHTLMTNDVSRRHSEVHAETRAYLQCAGSFAAVTLALRQVTLV